MILFDTHAHYDDERFDEDRDQVLASLPDAGIGYVMNAASDMESSRKALGLAGRFSFLYASCGVHPHEAAGMRDEDFDELRDLYRHEKVKAIGEIGLDYHYDFSPREVQQRRFYEQLLLARELDAPVIVHLREATADCLKILREAPGVRGVCHSFSGSAETAEELLRLGFMLSFTGIITFKNARKSHEVIRMLPPDRYMIETDAPYLAPEPKRGRRNDSRLLIHILEQVAEIRGISAQQAARETTGNGLRFYGIEG